MNDPKEALRQAFLWDLRKLIATYEGDSHQVRRSNP